MPLPVIESLTEISPPSGSLVAVQGGTDPGVKVDVTVVEDDHPRELDGEYIT